MNNIAIILAGGIGTRYGNSIPKQFIKIHNIPVFIYTLQNFYNLTKILTIPKEYIETTKRHINEYNIKNTIVIAGGKTRQESCYKTLKYINENFKCDNVIVTDANRPCISIDTYNKCIKELKKYKGVIAVSKSINTSCIAYEDTLKEVLDRNIMYDLLMPQCFNFQLLYEAHKFYKKNNIITNATDDAQIVLYMKSPYIKIKLVEASYWEGLKLTYKQDYKIFELLLKKDKIK